MSDILDFYSGKGTDAAGRTFHDILQADDLLWEGCHDFVQWMFPLPEVSKAQPRSPVATQDDYNVIANDQVLKMRMLSALGRYLAFLDRTTAWRRAADHNHLRITRVLRCLCLCGLNDPAYEVFDYARTLVGSVVGKKTVWYWEEALKRHPAWLGA